VNSELNAKIAKGAKSRDEAAMDEAFAGFGSFFASLR
jgi:hypothetical protein